MTQFCRVCVCAYVKLDNNRLSSTTIHTDKTKRKQVNDTFYACILLFFAIRLKFHCFEQISKEDIQYQTTITIRIALFILFVALKPKRL